MNEVYLVYIILMFFLLVLVRIPVGFALGFTCIIYFLKFEPTLMSAIPARLFSGCNSFVIIALPLFILAGELMNCGGITNRLIESSMYIVRPIKGGLGEVNVIASMLFGGISGSSVADTSALGSVLIPNMVKKGYSMSFSAGVTVASSTMGQVIPPSIPMLIFSMSSGISVAQLFLAGIIPGVLIGSFQLFTVYVISKKRKYHPEPEPFVMKKFIKTTKEGMLAVIMPLIILISISFGIATATESAGIAVLYSLIIGFFIYKELKIKNISKILKKVSIDTGSILLIISFATLFTWILAIEQVPTMVGNFFLDLNMPTFVVLLIFDVLILLIGTFVDVSPAILLLTPMLMPGMENYGVSGLQFGMILIVGLGVGLVTPPVAMCLNAANKICGLPMGKIFKGALPFIACNFIVLILITFIPALSLWLPALFGY